LGSPFRDQARPGQSNFVYVDYKKNEVGSQSTAHRVWNTKRVVFRRKHGYYIIRGFGFFYGDGVDRNGMRSDGSEGGIMAFIIKKVLILFTALLLSSSLLAGCAAKKEDIIKCSKCNLSPTELKKQYDEKQN
jgi:hypothetical protein